MESGRKVYINGIFVPENEAKISIFDSALMFGDMVFEMTRSFNKKQFKLKEHLERLYTGMRILHIPLKMKIDEMEQICYQTIEENEPVFDEHDEHRLMINVSNSHFACQAKNDNDDLFFYDDLGYGELGAYGQRIIETKNIDKLAASYILQGFLDLSLKLKES